MIDYGLTLKGNAAEKRTQYLHGNVEEHRKNMNYNRKCVCMNVTVLKSRNNEIALEKRKQI